MHTTQNKKRKWAVESLYEILKAHVLQLKNNIYKEYIKEQLNKNYKPKIIIGKQYMLD
jgi:hypothetical protein